MNDKKNGTFIDELLSLADDAKELATEVVVTIPLSQRAVRTLAAEPYDPAITFAMRALVMDCGSQGGVRIMHHEGQIRVIIGEGISMRLSEGSTLGEAILRACDKEGTQLDGAEFPRR